MAFPPCSCPPCSAAKPLKPIVKAKTRPEMNTTFFISPPFLDFILLPALRPYLHRNVHEFHRRDVLLFLQDVLLKHHLDVRDTWYKQNNHLLPTQPQQLKSTRISLELLQGVKLKPYF